MAFQLPLILAGPIIRRVEPRLISVWMAFSEPVVVTLSVWSNVQNVGTSAGVVGSSIGTPSYSSIPVPTLTVGAKLHFALMAIQSHSPDLPLTPGTVYSYNVSWAGASGPGDLKSEGLLIDDPDPTSPPASPPEFIRRQLALGYKQGQLPTFVMPGLGIEKLRICHGSCRKAHGLGKDGLASLDFLIREPVLKEEHEKRPQMIFLTGDQIYADEVASALIPVLTDMGNMLIGKPETIPLVGSRACSSTAQDLPAFSRTKLIKSTAKFTSDAAQNHLISFGEFCATYLIGLNIKNWSDELMQLDEDVKEADLGFIDSLEPSGAIADLLTTLPTDATKKAAELGRRKGEYIKEVQDLVRFRDTVPFVTRALANTVVYMIFDDHEITDDWYLTKNWRDQVLTSQLGVTILRNGLMAYALFQGWGNDPLAFLPDPAIPYSASNQMLMQLAASLYSAATVPDNATANKVDKLLGFDGTDPPVRWHYKVPAGPTTAYVLDCRTRRHYDRRYSPPALLSNDALVEQLPLTAPGPGAEVVFIIAQTPVLGMAVFEELIQPVTGAIMGNPYADLEAWAFNPEMLEAFLDKIHTYKKVVILSGDVHYGFTTLLDYWKKNSSGIGYEQSRVLQLVSSACKNESDLGTEQFFLSGRINQLESNAFFPSARVRWVNNSDTLVVSGVISPRNKVRLRRKPVLLSPGPAWQAGTTANLSPDSAWRLRPLLDQRPDDNSADARPADVQVTPMSSDNIAADSVKFYNQVMTRHIDNFKSNVSRRFVWLNNLGLVSFEKSGPTLTVHHELWYILPKDDTTDDPSGYTAFSATMDFSSDPIPQFP